MVPAFHVLFSSFLLYIVYREAVDASAISKLFHPDLMRSHDFVETEKLIIYEEIVLKKSERITASPYVLISDLQQYNEKSFSLLYGNQTKSIALVKHSENTVFHLLYISFALYDKFKDFPNVIEPVPATLKIHHSVIKFIDSSSTLYKLGRDRMLLTEEIGVGNPRGKCLGIQFVPGALEFENISAETVIKEISNIWSSGSNAISIDTDILMSGINLALEVERAGEGKWRELRDDAARSAGSHPCQLPEKSTVEYEGDFVRIVDLSSFTGPGAGCLVRLVEVAAMDNRVLSVTLEDRPVLLNYAAKGVLQSGIVGVEPLSSEGLTGIGQIVGVADSGLNDLSCYFYDTSGLYTTDQTTRSSIYSPTKESNRRKVIQYISYADGGDSVGGHGTHVCASIAGESSDDTFSYANGMAPKAKLVFLDMQQADQDYISVPNLYYYVFKIAYDIGARIHSNSWGSLSSGMYTSRTLSSDTFLYNYQDMLLVFAAGNSGADFGEKSVYNPCLSKNVLCVGSTNLRDDVTDADENQNKLEVSYFSSLGPTFDGRIKPDVVAPGFKILSALSGDTATKNSCGVTEMQGTSMSAPLVAGIAVLVREYFMSKWSTYCIADYSYCKNFYPSGYLLKAVFIHSGRPVGRYSSTEFNDKTKVSSFALGSPPDNYQGYGQVTLSSVLPTSINNNFDLFVYDFSVYSKKIYLMTVNIKEVGHLKVTLVWYDPPSSVGDTDSLLIHNLDLVIIDTYGKKWYGNDAHGSGTADYSNPQEQIHISDAVPGKYCIYIVGNTMPEAEFQKAAIIVTSSFGYVSSEPVYFSGNIPNGNTATPSEDLHNEFYEAPADHNASYSKTYGFTEIISNVDEDCIGSFYVKDSTIISSVKIDLESENTLGTAAFLFTVILRSPSDLIVQIGGYQNWLRSFNIMSRSWPVQWAQKAAGSQSSWRATRNLDAMNLKEEGRWMICVTVVYSNWQETKYVGEITVNFRTLTESATITTGQLFMGRFHDWIIDNAGVFASFVIIFCLSFMTIALLYVQKRRAAAAATTNSQKDLLHLLPQTQYPQRSHLPTPASAARSIVWPSIYSRDQVYPDDLDESDASNFLGNIRINLDPIQATISTDLESQQSQIYSPNRNNNRATTTNTSSIVWQSNLGSIQASTFSNRFAPKAASTATGFKSDNQPLLGDKSSLNPNDSFTEQDHDEDERRSSRNNLQLPPLPTSLPPPPTAIPTAIPATKPTVKKSDTKNKVSKEENMKTSKPSSTTTATATAPKAKENTETANASNVKKSKKSQSVTLAPPPLEEASMLVLTSKRDVRLKALQSQKQRVTTETVVTSTKTVVTAKAVPATPYGYRASPDKLLPSTRTSRDGATELRREGGSESRKSLRKLTEEDVKRQQEEALLGESKQRSTNSKQRQGSRVNNSNRNDKEEDEEQNLYSTNSNNNIDFDKFPTEEQFTEVQDDLVEIFLRHACRQGGFQRARGEEEDDEDEVEDEKEEEEELDVSVSSRFSETQEEDVISNLKRSLSVRTQSDITPMTSLYQKE